ncbi:uncharacterized protein LOC120343238 [Styela clava]
MKLLNRMFHFHVNHKKYFLILLILLISTSTNARRNREENSKQSRSNSCRRNHKFDKEEKCDTATNCRYGGMCRKVTDITANGATIRVVVPLDIDDLYSSDENRRTSERRKSLSLNPLFHKMEYPLQEECVCNFPCGHRHKEQKQEVCGSNGKTYSTECHLKRDSCRCQMEITVKWSGSCKNDTLQLDLENKKQGKKQRTCAKGCKFGAKCDPAGICRCKIECDVQALSYVCGKDGRTYTNECHVRQSECRHQMEIGILHSGTCSAEERLRRESQEFLRAKATVNPCETLDCNAAVADPLCGTDEISYPNECVLRHASCVKEQEIQVQHKGYCRKIFDVEVPTTVEPATTSMANTLVAKTDDPCIGIVCHHNAVCILHEDYDFICSCEAICDRMVSDMEVDTSGSESSYHALAAMWPSARILQFLENDEQSTDVLDKTQMISDGGVWGDAIMSMIEMNNFTAEQPVLIQLEEKESNPVREKLVEQELDTSPDRARIRRRRNKNSRRGRHRGEYHESMRSKRSTGGLRPLFEEVLCGTDRKTYMNECEMKKEACYNRKRISIFHIGACSTTIEKSTPNTKLLLMPTTATTIPNASILEYEEKPEIEKVSIIDESDKRSFEADYVIPTTKPKRRQRGKNRKNRNKNDRRGGGRMNRRERNGKRKYRNRKTESRTEVRDEIVSSDILNNLKLNAQTTTQSYEQNRQRESVLELRDENVNDEIMKDLGTNETVPMASDISSTKAVLHPYEVVTTGQKNSSKGKNDFIQTREEIINDIFLYPGSEGKINSTQNRSSDSEYNQTGTDLLRRRSENVPSKDYRSLWNKEKKQELLKNRAMMVKQRYENAKYKNTTRHYVKDVKEKTFKPDTGMNTVSLALAIGLGPVVVIIVLVGLFIYIKTRKKLKDLPETKENPEFVTKIENGNTNTKR